MYTTIDDVTVAQLQKALNRVVAGSSSGKEFQEKAVKLEKKVAELLAIPFRLGALPENDTLMGATLGVQIGLYLALNVMEEKQASVIDAMIDAIDAELSRYEAAEKKFASLEGKKESIQ